jgi:transcriptional repressor of dcmA and dcmR
MRPSSDIAPDKLRTEDAETLLDIEEAARFLHVSETSLRRWTNDGRLACHRIGLRRERRFRKADLLAFLESEPAGRSHAGGTHLCGLYSSDDGQVRQALAFLSGGFPPGTATFLLGDEASRARILAALEQAHPTLARDMAEGRLVASGYASSVEEQLRWWASSLDAALRRGATRLRAIGDAGGFAQAASREELAHYESTWDAHFAHRYPLVAMCQYDVRQFSGLAVLDVLKAHPDCFGHRPEPILA